MHCGEVASYVDIARRSGVGVSEADLDAFVDEQRRGAAVMGLDPDAVPASVGGLEAYYEEIRPGLYACPEAKQALRKSFHPDVPAEFRALKLMVPPLNTLAFASLPRWARKMYGTPGTPLTDAGTTVALRMAHGASVHHPHPAPAALPARRPRGPPAAAATGARAPGRRLAARAVAAWVTAGAARSRS